MGSTLSVDTIQGSTSATSVDLSGVTSLQMPAGAIVQVQRASISNVNSTTSTSYVDSGLGVTITPKFSTSKLFISVNLGRPNIQGSGRQMDLKLYEGSSPLDGNRLGSFFHNVSGAIYYGSTAYNHFRNAVNTTTRTYNVYFKATNGAVHISDASDIESAIIVMEIAQ